MMWKMFDTLVRDLLLIGVIIGIILASLVGLGVWWASSPPTTASAVVQELPDLPGTESAKVGSLYEVTLTSRPGTGSSWKVVRIPACMKLAMIKSETSKTPGGEEKETYCFMAEKKGVGILRLEYGRPWEKESSKFCEKMVVVHE